MSDYGGRLIRDTEPTVNTTTASGIWTIEEALKYKKAGTWPTPVYSEPNFKQTVLLLHGDGTNGAQNNTFLDSSTNNFTITRNGNTTQGTFSPFSVGAGEWSNYFDGTGDKLTVAANAAFQFGAGNFSIEFWFYPTSLSNYQTPIDMGYTSSGAYALQTGLGNGIPIFYASGSVVLTSSSAWVVNAFNHVVVCRSGTTLSMFINGSRTATTTNSTNFNSNSSLGVGAAVTGGSGGDYPVVGYMSNVRIIKGSTPYDPTQTTLTAPTAPLTAITNTSLLTCQSNRFVDNSTNAFAITRNGDVRVTPFSPFAPTAAYSAGTNGGSGYFDGVGDYLQSASSTEYNFGTGNFTIEFWVYPIAGGTAASYTLLPLVGSNGSFSTGESVNWNLWYDITGGTKLIFERQVSGTYSSVTSNSYTLPFLSWTHISVVRNSGTVTFYANGVSIGGGSFTADINITQALNIGVRFGGAPAFSVGWYGNMYLSGIKIVKGTATAPSGIPTTPPTGGNLLLNFTNAGIIDNTGKNNLETVGNAQIDTAVKQFGTGSLEFDGTGDFLSFPQSEELSMGSGSFTYELWINPTDNTAVCIFDTRTANNNTTGFTLLLNGSSNLAIYTNTTVLTCSGTVSTGVWTHIAVVRNGTTLTVYANGSSVGTLTFSNNLTDKSFRVGEYVDGTGDFTGFIDDLRITKGVARYTANFTAPTAPFLDQ